MTIRTCCSRFANANGQGFWKGLCGLCLSFVCHGSNGSGFTGLLKDNCKLCKIDRAIQTCFFQIIDLQSLVIHSQDLLTR